MATRTQSKIMDGTRERWSGNWASDTKNEGFLGL